VIGHVGRFAEQKNHRFLIDIATALRHRTRNFRIVLVGDGHLRSAIESEIVQRKLADHIISLGSRSDCPRLFSSLFDVFLFPSLFEGLGLVVVESQAANCPVVMSDVVPAEADVVPKLITRHSLSDSADIWADSLLGAAVASRSRASWVESHHQVSNSAFNILKCAESLVGFYQDATRVRAVG
jgi:glycosyltransferase involved in cell wall biosynthesis